MDKYSGKLLTRLIDKYENSTNYRSDDAQRRIIFNFTPKDLPEYFDRKSAEPRVNYNEVCKMLEAQDLIQIEWQKYLQNQVIKRVILNEAESEQVYRLLKRKPLIKKENTLSALLNEITITMPWLQEFQSFISERLQQGKSVASYLKLDDMPKNKLILTSLGEITQLSQETPKRVFSSRFLGDSKAFASVEAVVAKILREFYFKDTDNYQDKDEIFAELGLVNNPQYVYISGGITLSYNSNTFDLKDCAPGIAIPALWLDDIQVKQIQAERLITVENLTTFHQYSLLAKHNEVVLYLGGYHNRARRKLIMNIASACDLPIYHWGDIDAGGYDILRHLREQTGLPIKPWLMDPKTLQQYSQFAHQLDKNSEKRLTVIKDNPIMKDLQEDITEIIKLGLKLEQEAIPLYTM